MAVLATRTDHAPGECGGRQRPREGPSAGRPTVCIAADRDGAAAAATGRRFQRPIGPRIDTGASSGSRRPIHNRAGEAVRGRFPGADQADAPLHPRWALRPHARHVLSPEPAQRRDGPRRSTCRPSRPLPRTGPLVRRGVAPARPTGVPLSRTRRGGSGPKPRGRGSTIRPPSPRGRRSRPTQPGAMTHRMTVKFERRPPDASCSVRISEEVGCLPSARRRARPRPTGGPLDTGGRYRNPSATARGSTGPPQDAGGHGADVSAGRLAACSRAATAIRRQGTRPACRRWKPAPWTLGSAMR